jgi:putative MATE family efflux protein
MWNESGMNDATPRTPGPDPSKPAPRANPLVDGPILPTLVGLAWPNMIALSTQSIAVVAETSFIGMIGTEALAAMALVFPTIALTQMMSAGAMGGGVSSAISRALGAGNEVRARTLALHALAIGVTVGIAMSLIFFSFRAPLFALLGGKGTVLTLAVQYAGAFFSGALAVWVFNTLVSVVRGTGNMRLSSASVITVAAIQIVLGAILSLGLLGAPRLGLVGIALGQVTAHALGAIALLWHLTSGGARLRLGFAGARPDPAMFFDILKVGAVACLSPIQSILVVVILARLAADYGTTALAGFGIGIRLELLLVPIAFAIGVACVPMVGMAIGAGLIDRARRVAWTGATLAGALIGSIGILVAWQPWLWGRIFTADAAVLGAVDTYLGIAGLGFPAYGFGLCLYFASQGSGRILGPVLGNTVRLAVVLAGGWLLVRHQGSFAALAWLIAAAMLAYGCATAFFVWMTRWGPRPTRT